MRDSGESNGILKIKNLRFSKTDSEQEYIPIVMGQSKWVEIKGTQSNNESQQLEQSTIIIDPKKQRKASQALLATNEELNELFGKTNIKQAALGNNLEPQGTERKKQSPAKSRIQSTRGSTQEFYVKSLAIPKNKPIEEIFEEKSLDQQLDICHSTTKKLQIEDQSILASLVNPLQKQYNLSLKPNDTSYTPAFEASYTPNGFPQNSSEFDVTVNDEDLDKYRIPQAEMFVQYPQKSNDAALKLLACQIGVKFMDWRSINSDILIKRYQNCIHFKISEFRHIFWYSNDNYYVGGFDEKKIAKQGFGYEVKSMRHKYKGNFIAGSRQGLGRMLSVNGTQYFGHWEANKKHGHGKQTYEDGSFYEGQWRNNLYHGLGVQVLKNKQIFTGNFRQGKRYGHGLWTDKPQNGDKYVGNYLNDLKHGYGQYYWSNGQIYKGYFYKGFMNHKSSSKQTNKSIHK